MNDNEYAVSNLETLKYNIHCYVSFAKCKDDDDVQKAMEQAEKALQRLINKINKKQSYEY